MAAPLSPTPSPRQQSAPRGSPGVRHGEVRLPPRLTTFSGRTILGEMGSVGPLFQGPSCEDADLRRVSGAALVLLGAASFYALGRLGGGSPGRDLLPILGPDTGEPLAALLVGLLAFAAGIILLSRRAARETLPPEVARWSPIQAIALLQGMVVIACLVTVALGTARGWNPMTIGACAALAAVEAGIGVALVPYYLRSRGPRSVSVVSSGLVVLGAAWTALILALGLL